MAEQKKMVEAITSMEDDFAQWYTDVVKKADLVDYSSVEICDLNDYALPKPILQAAQKFGFLT